MNLLKSLVGPLLGLLILTYIVNSLYMAFAAPGFTIVGIIGFTGLFYSFYTYGTQNLFTWFCVALSILCLIGTAATSPYSVLLNLLVVALGSQLMYFDIVFSQQLSLGDNNDA